VRWWWVGRKDEDTASHQFSTDRQPHANCPKQEGVNCRVERLSARLRSRPHESMRSVLLPRGGHVDKSTLIYLRESVTSSYDLYSLDFTLSNPHLCPSPRAIPATPPDGEVIHTVKNIAPATLNTPKPNALARWSMRSGASPTRAHTMKCYHRATTGMRPRPCPLPLPKRPNASHTELYCPTRNNY
jgi:hypothetical protein